MGYAFLKAFGIWLLLLFLAVLNGAVREKLLAPIPGPPALPLSGITFPVIIFIAAYLLLPSGISTAQYRAIGAMWAALTVLFEFIFGHFVMGRPWADLLDAYRMHGGNLWPLVLAFLFFTPYLVAKVSGDI